MEASCRVGLAEKEVRPQNLNCEKVIQIILSLRVPAHEVIAAVNQRIESSQTRAVRSRGNLEMSYDEKRIGERQSRIC